MLVLQKIPSMKPDNEPASIDQLLDTTIAVLREKGTPKAEIDAFLTENGRGPSTGREKVLPLQAQ